MKSPIRAFLITIAMVPPVIFGQQLENPGFENWEDAGTVKDEPVDWSSVKTCDNPGIASQAPVCFDRSEEKHSGNYSLKIYNRNVFGIIATGAMTNGRFHAEFDLDASYSYTQADDPQWHTPFTWRPDSLAGWFKFFPREDDRAQFKVILHVDECKIPENGTLPNWIGMAVYVTEPGVTYDSWTRFSVPFHYYDERVPEYELSVVNSGDSTSAVDSSYMFVDDLQLIYPSSGITEHRITEPFLIQNGNQFIISIKDEDEYLDQWFYLIDVKGQTVMTLEIKSNHVEITDRLPQGAYVAVLSGKSRQFSQKIIVP